MLKRSKESVGENGLENGHSPKFNSTILKKPGKSVRKFPGPDLYGALDMVHMWLPNAIAGC